VTGRTGEIDSAPPIALVTGASSGIGYDLARLLAADRHDLVLVARGAGRLAAISSELAAQHGIRALPLPADLSDPASPETIASALRERGLAVDILINNAGFGTYGPFASSDAARELAMLQVNIVSLVHLTRLFLPAMIERGRGRVLNVASTAAFQPGPLMSGYYASKAFVLHFSEALSNEVEGRGVTVTALCPGPTRTNFQIAAEIRASRLVRGSLMMDSGRVAREGYDAMLRGDPLVVPGFRNRMLSRAVRFLPRRLVTRMVRRFQDRAAT